MELTKLTQGQRKSLMNKFIKNAIKDIDSAKEYVNKAALNLSLDVVPFKDTSWRIKTLKSLLQDANFATQKTLVYFREFASNSKHKEENSDSKIID